MKRSIWKNKRNRINEQAKLAEEAEKKGDIKLHNITRKLSQRKFKTNRPVKNHIRKALNNTRRTTEEMGRTLFQNI